jgi:hypothetical protein
MKSVMVKRCEMKLKLNIHTEMRQWRIKGKFVCRHGVFFDAAPPVACPCLQAGGHADWSNAMMMPALHNDLKCVVADTFDASSFQRLGILQAEARRRSW